MPWGLSYPKSTLILNQEACLLTLLVNKIGRRMDLLNPRMDDSSSFSLSARSVYTNISPRLRNIGYRHKQITDDIYFTTVAEILPLGRH